MPTIKENYGIWNEQYDWEKEGHEWSSYWGSTDAMWWGTIFPRIQEYLMNSSVVLEIAPGFGRCTDFLKNYPNSLMIVDLSEKCINSCKEKFKKEEHISYFKNDGLNLEMIPNGEIDFIFSWDSLVHAEENVLKSYIYQFKEKLSEHGVAFIHHSNLLEVSSKTNVVNNHWRAKSVSAKKVKEFCEEAGLCCFSQELINWDGENLIDCITMITKNDSKFVRNYNKVENYRFLEEAKIIRGYYSLYHSDVKKSTYYDELYKKILNLKRPIYLWGTGSTAERNFQKLDEKNIAISGFIDNDANKHGKEFMGLEVCSLKKVMNQEPFIIISSTYYEKISDKLEKRGYLEGQDFLLFL